MSLAKSGVFRANARYTLVLLDRLEPAERQLVSGFQPDGDLYGILRPQPGSGLELRSASSEIALLFLTLAEPGPLPSYLFARLGDELEQTIARLVLDAVLEIERQGNFVSGARAGAFLVSGRSQGGHDRIGELSRAALRYGQDLAGLPESLLALRLYCYGRRPVSVALRHRLVNEVAVAAHLGLGPRGSARNALATGWYELPPARGERRYWRRWHTRPASGRATKPAGANYKLYVSPTLEGLEVAVGAVASSLAMAPGVSAFKVGADVYGVSRPDKLVVYFDQLDDLHAGAAMLRKRLRGCPAHGVPFTAAITPDGLLSWGADPPAGASTNGDGATSWRMWVTERLAEYLTVAARSDCGQLEPWQLALERLQLSGVDTDTWVPVSGMWPNAQATG
jgi:hypothetical protein